MRRRFRPPNRPLDPVLTLAFLGLASLGVLLIYSATYYQEFLRGAPLRQGGALVLGLVLQVLIARRPAHLWLRWGPWLYLASLAPLLAIPWLGIEVNGARRWLPIGVLGTFQPSELIKVTLLLCQLECLRRRQYLWAVLAFVPPALLVLRQPDLGTVGCYAAITLVGLFVRGVNWRLLAGATVVGLLGLSQGLHDYQRQRLLVFLNPESDAAGAGWNLIQAKIAVGSGGILGLGIFQGLQKRLLYVPEQHTDFLFTVLGEEMGLLGGLLVLLLFSLLYLRAFDLAGSAPTEERRWLTLTVSCALAFQTAVNMAMVLGLFPVTGIPLPLLSYGGTAVLSQSLLLGLLQAEATEQWRQSRLQPRLRWAPRS